MIPDDEYKRMTDAGYSLISAGVEDHDIRVIEARVASDGFGVWIRTRYMGHQPDRSGTCRHARQIQEVWTGNMQAREIASHVEKPERYTCGYLEQFQLPPAVARWSHGLDIRKGDCESCPLYETPELPEVLKASSE